MGAYGCVWVHLGGSGLDIDMGGYGRIGADMDGYECMWADGCILGAYGWIWVEMGAWVDMGRYERIWVDRDGYGCMWVSEGEHGWTRGVGMGGYGANGYIWVHMGGYGTI